MKSLKWQWWCIIIGFLILFSAQWIIFGLNRTYDVLESWPKPAIKCCQKADSIPAPKPLAYLPTEVKCNSNKTSCIVWMNGREENGVETLTLDSGEAAVIDCLSGCNRDGPSFDKDKRAFPFWGTPASTVLSEYKKQFRFYKYKVPAHAIIAILGGVYNPASIAYPKRNETKIYMENSSRKNLPLFLYYHDFKSSFSNNGLNGKRTEIIVQKNPYIK
ncbi:MAG: hypothetical protein HYV52_02410 [Parcubacteria group bacterium]|nr:hypothetical protein [Parcubacteria group bacterium]